MGIISYVDLNCLTKVDCFIVSDNEFHIDDIENTKELRTSSMLSCICILDEDP